METGLELAEDVGSGESSSEDGTEIERMDAEAHRWDILMMHDKSSQAFRFMI